ncbi:MAG TPA: hypothetical protein VI933_02865 [archaeon]|nr:hypothetical protein [archaeon]
MSAAVEGFFHTRGFAHISTSRPDPRFGEISVYQRRDEKRDTLFTASYYGGVIFLEARRYVGPASVRIDAPCPSPITEEEVQAVLLNSIEAKREKRGAASYEKDLLGECEALVNG